MLYNVLINHKLSWNYQTKLNHRTSCSTSSITPISFIILLNLFSLLSFTDPRRYGLLCGPSSRSCRGLPPMASSRSQQLKGDNEIFSRD